MKVNIWLHDRWYYNLNFGEAIELANEYVAEHGDVQIIVTESSTNKVVNQFKIEDHGRWYTFEELIELSYYLMQGYTSKLSTLCLENQF